MSSHKVQDIYIGMLLNKKAYMRLRHNHHPRTHRQTLSMLNAYLNNIHKQIEDFIQIHVIVAMDLCTCTYYIFTRKLHITHGYSLVWGLIKQAVCTYEKRPISLSSVKKTLFFSLRNKTMNYNWLKSSFSVWKQKKKGFIKKSLLKFFLTKYKKKIKIQLLKDLN